MFNTAKPFTSNNASESTVAVHDPIGSIFAESGSCDDRQKISCSQCDLNALCLPVVLTDSETARFEDIVNHARQLLKGAHLYRQQEPFKSIYIVHSGTFKGYRITDGGEEQITGFYYPGDIIGIDGICTYAYTNSAVALESASACEISYEALHQLCSSLPVLQRRFFQTISGEIARAQELAAILGKFSAEQRVAALLLIMLRRINSRRAVPNRLFLAMTRGEIGNYLGLAMETVSRVFSHLQSSGAIDVESKEVIVLDIDLLNRIANGRVQRI